MIIVIQEKTAIKSMFSNFVQYILCPFTCCIHLHCALERHGLNNSKQVDLLKHRITNLLKDHVTYNGAYSGGRNKPVSGGLTQFSRIMDLRQTLRSLNVQGLQRIFYLKLEDLVPAPPLIEKMFASSIPF